MRKTIAVLIAVMLVMSFVMGCTAAEPEIEAPKSFGLTMQIGNPVMTVNGEERSIDAEGTAPTVENGRTLVPIRAVIEAMGGNADWQAETRTAVLTLGEDTVKLTIDSTEAFFNDRKDELDTAPMLINGRTMLPIRYIAECFAFIVDWNEATRTVSIAKEIKAEEPTEEPEKEKKTLVVYFSASGHTEKVANYIKDAMGADILELVPEQEYTDDDLNYSDSDSRVCKEHDDESLRDVKLKVTTPENWSDYDTVFIGYPIWWGIAAWPVDNFVKGNDFTGKTVIPFCTSASSSLGQSGQLLSEMAGTGDWQEGMRFRSGAGESDVKAWVESLK